MDGGAGRGGGALLRSARAAAARPADRGRGGSVPRGALRGGHDGNRAPPADESVSALCVCGRGARSGGVCRDAGAASSLFRGEKRAFAGESARMCQKS